MRDDNIKVEKTIDLISSVYQIDINENTLSFLWRKRECIKMIASCFKSAAKVAYFNENSKN